MYTKGSLESYAETIRDQELQEEFCEKINKIVFNEDRMCLEVEAEEAFRNFRVAGLFRDFKASLYRTRVFRL